MKRGWFGLVLAAACLPAQAQIPPREVPTIVGIETREITTLPKSWSTEVPLGRVVRLSRPISCSFNRVSLTMRVNKISLDSANKIGPTVAVFLSDRKHDAPDAPSDENAVFTVKPISADNIPVVFFKTTGGNILPGTVFGTIDLEEDYAITMSWNEKGEVTAQIEGDKGIISLSRPPASITLLIGGAAADFSDIETDLVGSLPPNCPPPP
jgi:hypothetical protein